MESDFRYFSRRAAEERRRAQFAITQAARQRHDELADMFASKAAHGAGDDVLTRIRVE
jgi:hypothetical protein